MVRAGGEGLRSWYVWGILMDSVVGEGFEVGDDGGLGRVSISWLLEL